MNHHDRDADIRRAVPCLPQAAGSCFVADQGGKPVPGGEYAQYMFEYVTDRSHVGHQVFGSVGDQSLTTHILFLNEKDANLVTDFENALKSTTAKGVTEYKPEVDGLSGGATETDKSAKK